MNNRSLKNDFNPELEEIHRPPLTFKELRERVKHIAGLCWGLSIDLQNEIERNAAITAEFEQLEKENAAIKSQLDEAIKELKQCNKLAAQNEGLKLENERLKQAVATEQEKRKRAEIDAHAAQLAWERKTYGNTTCELTNGHKQKETKKQRAKEARAKRRAEFEALPEKERKRREMQRLYNRRYYEKKRAEKAQGGNDGSNQN